MKALILTTITLMSTSSVLFSQVFPPPVQIGPKYSLVAADNGWIDENPPGVGHPSVYLSWEWIDRGGTVTNRIFRRGNAGERFSLIATIENQTCFVDEDPGNLLPDQSYDYYVRYYDETRYLGRTQTVFDVIPTGDSDPPPVIYSVDLPEVEMINPGVGVLDGNRRLTVWRVGEGDSDVDNAILYGYNDRGEEIFQFNTLYDKGATEDKGGVRVPFLLWDFDNDGRSEIVVRRVDPDADPDSTYITILGIKDDLTVEVKAEIEFPYVEITGNWPKPRYMAVAYLDGYDKTPSIIAQAGVSSSWTAGAYRVTIDDNEWTIEKRWQFKFDDRDTDSVYAGAAHGIFPADVDGDGEEEILFGTTCVDEDEDDYYYVKWYVGESNHPNGYDGWVVGHADIVSVGDIMPDSDGVEVMYCVEKGNALHGAPGVYVIHGDDGRIFWYDLIGHADNGWLADVTEEYSGLEIGAWNKRRSNDPPEVIETWRVYGYNGTTFEPIFMDPWPEEVDPGEDPRIYDSPANKYQHPLRWTDPDRALIIVRENSNYKWLGSLQNGEWINEVDDFLPGYEIRKRWVKGDLGGDARDEIVTWINPVNTIYFMTNTTCGYAIDMPSPGSGTTYKEWQAIAGSSYTLYPLWIW